MTRALLRLRLLIAGMTVAACAAGCSSTSDSPPTAETTVVLSPPSSTTSATFTTTTTQSSESVTTTAASPETTSAASPQTSTSAPWSSQNLTEAQIADAQAALAAYAGYWSVADAAGPNLSADWTSEIRKYATDPAAAAVLTAIRETALRGQSWGGTTHLNPVVTKVQPGVVDLTDCVDSTDTTFVDKDGKSIKAPDAPGSYFRHISQVQVAEFTDGWRVYSITDDYTQTC